MYHYVFITLMILMMVESSIALNFHNKLDDDIKAGGGVSFGYSISIIALIGSLAGIGFAGYKIYRGD